MLFWPRALSPVFFFPKKPTRCSLIPSISELSHPDWPPLPGLSRLYSGGESRPPAIVTIAAIAEALCRCIFMWLHIDFENGPRRSLRPIAFGALPSFPQLQFSPQSVSAPIATGYASCFLASPCSILAPRSEMAYEFSGRTYDHRRIAIACIRYDKLRVSYLARGDSGGLSRVGF